MKIKKLDLDKEKLSDILVGSILLLTTTGTIMYYSRTSKCDIKERHEHLYTNDEIVAYFESEKINKDGLTRTDDYKIIDNIEDEELYKIINKNKLISINDNLEFLEKNASNNNKHIEYQYSKLVRYRRGMRYVYNYESDINKDLDYTGIARETYREYYAYKIEKNDKGKYKVIESGPLSNLTDISIREEYPYIKSKYYYDRYNKEYKIDINKERESSNIKQ